MHCMFSWRAKLGSPWQLRAPDKKPIAPTNETLARCLLDDFNIKIIAASVPHRIADSVDCCASLASLFWMLEPFQIKGVLHTCILAIAKDMGNGVNTCGVRKTAGACGNSLHAAPHRRQGPDARGGGRFNGKRIGGKGAPLRPPRPIARDRQALRLNSFLSRRASRPATISLGSLLGKPFRQCDNVLTTRSWARERGIIG
jgi:hypothetical protein